jgi:hypothetical protein
MSHEKAAPPTPQQRWGARGSFSIADRTSPIANSRSHTTQAPIRSELIGDNTCTTAGLIARGSAPVLALARLLIEAGHDSNRPLHAFRGDILALTIRSIGEGARLRIATHGVGFERLPECTGGPPVRQNASGVVGLRAGDVS